MILTRSALVHLSPLILGCMLGAIFSLSTAAQAPKKGNNAQESNEVLRAWNTFVPLKIQKPRKPSLEDFLWMEGDWKVVGKTIACTEKQRDYDKLEHIEILKVKYIDNPRTGEQEIYFGGWGFGKYQQQFKSEGMVYRGISYASDGYFCLGLGMVDAFELRTENKSPPDAFVLRHEKTPSDMLLFRRIQVK